MCQQVHVGTFNIITDNNKIYSSMGKKIVKKILLYFWKVLNPFPKDCCGMDKLRECYGVLNVTMTTE